MADVLVVAYLILLSTLKFLFVPFLSVHVHNFSFLTSALINIAGGVIGISFYFKASSYFIERAIKKRKEAILNNKKSKKVFTRTSRFLVKVKNTMGMYGLAFLILPFASIPIGTIVSAKYYHLKKGKMLFLLYTSCVVWSFLLSAIAYLF